jgi:hypothetical protein
MRVNTVPFGTLLSICCSIYIMIEDEVSGSPIAIPSKHVRRLLSSEKHFKLYPYQFLSCRTMMLIAVRQYFLAVVWDKNEQGQLMSSSKV